MGSVLRYGHHAIPLRPGRFLVGRAATCELALDDPLVSREHAALVVSESGVRVEDLGSRNGVLRNGVRVQGSAPVEPGDRLQIGSQELVLASEASAPAPTRAAPTARFSSFGVMGALADKALALGHADEAERVLAAPLAEIRKRADSTNPADRETCEKAAAFATRLALATGKAEWVDYSVALFRALRRPLPATVVDALHEALRRVGAIDLGALRAYLDELRTRSPDLGPGDRFLVSRIEGLERVAATR
jgi:hypothetical protein